MKLKALLAGLLSCCRFWMRKRWVKMLGVVLAPFVLFALFLVFERLRGQLKRARIERHLIAKGEKLHVSASAVAHANEENGAPDVYRIVLNLMSGVLLPKSLPARMKLTLSGRAVICYREAEWTQDGTVWTWDQLKMDLKTNQSVLSEIRTSLKKPVLDNKLDLTLGGKLRFSHIANAKTLATWFGAGIQLALHEKRHRDAAEDLIAHVNLLRLLAGDRIVISELVRYAIASIARFSIWEALQDDGWTDADLATIQKAWETQAFYATCLQALEGELVYGHYAYESLRRSNAETIGHMYGMEEVFPLDNDGRPLWEQFLRKLTGGNGPADFLKKQVYCRLWRFAWLDQDQARNLEIMERFLAIVREAGREKSFTAVAPAIKQLDEDFKSDSSCKGWYDRWRYPSSTSPITLTGVANKAMRAETERSIVLCAIAIKRHRLRHGTLPATLESLIPEFLSSAPIDYMDGRPLKYLAEPDGHYRLYSVGEDGRDDGGDTAMRPGEFNTRNLWSRKDFAWPEPALPEELEASRMEKR